MFGWFVQIQTRLDPNKVNWNASKTISLPLWANLYYTVHPFYTVPLCPCKPVHSSSILDNELGTIIGTVLITHRLNVWFRQTLSSPWGWFFIVLNWFIHIIYDQSSRLFNRCMYFIEKVKLQCQPNLTIDPC